MIYHTNVKVVFMENPSHVISKNLKKIRNENGLSLDAVSKLTGVSKGMLGQIEREEVNPTITTILKIANGLKISFTSLLSEKEADVKIVELKKVSPIYDDSKKWRSYPLFTFEDSSRITSYNVCYTKLLRLSSKVNNG